MLYLASIQCCISAISSGNSVANVQVSNLASSSSEFIAPWYVVCMIES